MLSRVADSLYWMSRYLERAEHATRLLDVNLNLMLDESAASAERRWERVLLALGKPKDLEWTGDHFALTQSLIFDTGNKASIVSCIIAARENSRHVREQISTEQWHRLNSLYLEVTGPEVQNGGHLEALAGQASEPTEFLQSVMEAVHQFQGVTDSTMNHGEGWQFIQVGRYIERASATALLLEAYHGDLWEHPEGIPGGNEYLDWMGLLRSATAFEAYCKVYTADLTPDRIFEFLLLDEEFPHSVRFSIDSLQCALDKIQGDSGRARVDALRRLGGRLQASLNYSSADEILNQDVVAYLRNIQAQCRAIHETIYELYVDYSIQAALAS
ncbi:MAG: alpha-E domain-containing protein [Acidobacteriota bacterium]|nr:alpha-E domain-containing protein [Acidobacteriota bacterium]